MEKTAYDHDLVARLLGAALALSGVGERMYRNDASKPEIWDRRHQMLKSLMESYERGGMPQ